MQLSTVRTQRWEPAASTAATQAGVAADPFHDRLRRDHVLSKQLLGGRFRFESNSEALLQLVEAAFGGVPPHQLPEPADF
jgi:hypothetical protein